MERIVNEEDVIEYIISFDHEPKIVIMSGLAGSGKTTFAKKLEKLGFHRLSIDEEIWSKYGKYGIDYPKAKYDILQVKASEVLFNKFLDLLRQRHNLVIDLSFWQRDKRNEYKEIIEKHDGKWFLIFMNTPISKIKQRLKIRNQIIDANSAFPITESILKNFKLTFEVPENEGQIEIK